MSVTPFTYELTVNQQVYGLHIPYSLGYDATSQRRRPASYRRAEDVGASGYFMRANGAQIALWITDITADFSLAGEVGQSRMVREFYPRSFNDVPLHITGNVASTQEYNRLAAFIREHQWTGLNHINQGGTADQSITFALHNNTPKAFVGTRNTKGGHQPWQVQGYITTIAAGAVAHEVAPQFEIDFIVSDSSSINPMTGSSNTAIWQEYLEGGSVLNSFIGLVNADVRNGSVFPGFIPSPKAAKTPTTQHTPANPLITQPVGPWSVATTAGSNPLSPFTTNNPIP